MGARGEVLWRLGVEKSSQLYNFRHVSDLKTLLAALVYHLSPPSVLCSALHCTDLWGKSSLKLQRSWCLVYTALYCPAGLCGARVLQFWNVFINIHNILWCSLLAQISSGELHLYHSRTILFNSWSVTALSRPFQEWYYATSLQTRECWYHQCQNWGTLFGGWIWIYRAAVIWILAASAGHLLASRHPNIGPEFNFLADSVPQLTADSRWP